MSDPNSGDTARKLKSWQGALVGLAAGFIFAIFSGVLVKLSGSARMGEVLFILLPLIVGATIALVTPRPLIAVVLLSSSISLLMCLGFLITLHVEGLLCAIIAFPLIFVALTVGVVVGLFVREMVRPSWGRTTNGFLLLAAPLLIYGGERLEMKTFTEPRTEIVSTTIHVNAAPQQVWANIQSLDKLAGRKPMLMYLGLPIPQRCELRGTAVGSKRTCYFDQGSIEETILEWDPPRRMRLAIDRTNMPGRHWLEFDGAEYILQADRAGTTITRVTTIRSNLRPAWYWARFEKWGVQSEHEYLFSDLAGRFPTPPQQ